VSRDYDKDYKTSNIVGLYKEEETNRNFFFKQFFGLDYPVRCYTDTAAPDYDFTSEDLDRQDQACIDIVTFYQAPNNPELPSLQTLTLQRISNSGISISDIIHHPESKYSFEVPTFQLSKGLTFEARSRKIASPFALADLFSVKDFFTRKPLIIWDHRPTPIIPINVITGEFQNVNRNAIWEYIKPRYQDWVEAGGHYLERNNLGGPFWIDLWSEEALEIYRDPLLDKHPQKLLIRDWWDQHRSEKE
jgi:hypothetical protein